MPEPRLQAAAVTLSAAAWLGCLAVVATLPRAPVASGTPAASISGQPCRCLSPVTDPETSCATVAQRGPASRGNLRGRG